MGKVIKIEVPLYRSIYGIHLPGHQGIAHVKGNRTLEDVGIAKSHDLPGHQKAPIIINWSYTTGPPFCNYCKSEGHLIGTSAHRLSVLCGSCNAKGHFETQYGRLSDGDRKADKGKDH
ncbi:hypothetical protein BGX24_000543 [Mortierella sp. AD032]|nr:hypothetical protein BGX24_000543 [Mortierella sp. AD032]